MIQASEHNRETFESTLSFIAQVIDEGATDYLHDNMLMDYLDTGGGRRDIAVMDALKLLKEFCDEAFWSFACTIEPPYDALEDAAPVCEQYPRLGGG